MCEVIVNLWMGRTGVMFRSLSTWDLSWINLGINGVEYCWKVASVGEVAVAIGSLLNGWSLQLNCGRVLHEAFIVPVLMHGRQ